jgi:hypothetical protein
MYDHINSSVLDNEVLLGKKTNFFFATVNGADEKYLYQCMKSN